MKLFEKPLTRCDICHYEIVDGRIIKGKPFCDDCLKKLSEVIK